MNFENWGHKLKQSASEAARHFNFDEMAKQDDYIHTESLNIKRKPKKTLQQTELATTRVTSRNLPNPTQDLSSPASPRTSTVQLLSVVQRTLEEPEVTPEHPSPSSSFHSLDDPTTSLELQLSRPPLGSDDKHDNAASSSPQPSLGNTTSEEQPKRHRFFQDLDDRLATPFGDDDEEQQALLAPPAATSEATSDTATTSPWHILSHLRVDNSSSQSSTTTPGPLWARTKTATPEEDDMMVHTTTTSASLLDTAELQTLQRLGRSEISLIDVIRANPREAFICLTVALGIFSYFYSSIRAVPLNVLGR